MDVIDYDTYKKFYLKYVKETGDVSPARSDKQETNWLIQLERWNTRYQKWLSDQRIHWKYHE